MGDRDEPPDAAAPYAATIALPADASAAAIARQFVEDNRDHLRPDLVADTQLLVSEIVTNAVLHGTPDITLEVRVDPPATGIAVSDLGESLPDRAPGPPPVDQPSVRGLLIVDALASAWGIRANEDAVPGKVVWFEIRPGCPALRGFTAMGPSRDARPTWPVCGRNWLPHRRRSRTARSRWPPADE